MAKGKRNRSIRRRAEEDTKGQLKELTKKRTRQLKKLRSK